VRDTTGITAGTVLRLWTPGLEEAITVASVAGDDLTLTRALGGTHPAGATCSSLPTTAREAVIKYATYLLMRPASTAESYVPGARGLSTTSTGGDARRTGRSTFLYDDACKLLKPFKRIR
jgi:hypothetical protein